MQHPIGGFAWLADRRLIYALGEHAESLPYDNLWVVATDPRSGLPSGAPLRRTRWVDFRIETLSATADGSLVCFRRYRRQRNIWTAALKAGGALLTPPQRLTHEESEDWPMTWTPDSKAVVFISNRSGTAQVYRQEIDKDTADVLTSGEQVGGLARISPDGKWLLYVIPETNTQIRLMRQAAVFLSGNGPLVKVLQHALKSSVFVQDVHGFLKTYGGIGRREPQEHIWVYDEAQRAWDAERVQGKRGHGASEPEDFLRLGSRMCGWALVVGLIGEGQEIHLGEEAGLGQWNDAITAVGGGWTVHCPAKVAQLFQAAKSIVTRDELDLTTSLRSHLAEDVQAWVRQVLTGELPLAARTAEVVAGQGFDMYITRDIEAAKAYVRERYAGNLGKTYGLLASSKAKNLHRYGIRNGFNYTRVLKEGPWYNDPPESRLSCCALYDVATEFACQGLELDFPIRHPTRPPDRPLLARFVRRALQSAGSWSVRWRKLR